MRRCSLILILALLSACDRPPTGPASAADTSSPPRAAAGRNTIHLDHAQPRLPTIKLWLGAAELTAELALTPTQIATGMMFRESMPENEGMLFVFARPQRTAFYMKNTRVPLSAAYIDPDGIILEIHDLQPGDETAKPASTDQVQYVLEVNQGWFKRHNLGVGATVRADEGTLREMFFERKVQRRQ